MFIASGGTEEFDCFAQVLGLALPSIADLLTGSSAMVVSDGDIEVAERSEQDSMVESLKQEVGEPVTPAGKVGSYGKRELFKKRMAGVMRIRSFTWKGYGKESPADFSEDVEMAAMSWDATHNVPANRSDATRIAIFRQNLDREGDAWHWWNSMLKQEEKKTIEAVKKAFLKRYTEAQNEVVTRFNVQNELMMLSQRSGQSIADYLQEAEGLSE